MIRDLVASKQNADRSEQKVLRNRLRSEFDFYISFFGTYGREGFTVADLEHLRSSGAIEIR
jgi:hypothetical protein